MRNQISHPMSSSDRNLSKNTGRYVKNTNNKSSFFYDKYVNSTIMVDSFYWNYIGSWIPTHKNLLLESFLIRPILDPKFPLMHSAIGNQLRKSFFWRFLEVFGNQFTTSCNLQKQIAYVRVLFNKFLYFHNLHPAMRIAEFFFKMKIYLFGSSFRIPQCGLRKAEKSFSHVFPFLVLQNATRNADCGKRKLNKNVIWNIA